MTGERQHGSGDIGRVGASFGRSNNNGWGNDVPAGELNKIKQDIAKLFQMVMELQRKVKGLER